MEKKRVIDLAIIGFCMAVAILSRTYLTGTWANYGMIGAGVIGVIMIVILIRDIRTLHRQDPQGKQKWITRVLLLSEENTILAEWDLLGKVSLVIGKDIGRHTVDINLSQTKYAGMIDHEHAVLNYCDKDWYIEDVGSTNGLRIQKAVDGKKYDLTSGQPCKIDLGDVIYIGPTRLALQ